MMILGLASCKHSSNADEAECQSKRFNLSSIEHEVNFGTIPDSVEVINHQIVLYNDLNQTVKITHVERTCGCTQLQLSDNVIMPKDSVFLDMSVEIGKNYHFFEKSISIHTDNSNKPLTVYIRATRHSPQEIIAYEFPLMISDNIRANIPFIIMGYIAHGDAMVSHINIMNNSAKETSFKVDMLDKPPYISIYYNDILKPNEIGRIAIMVDLTKIYDIWGVQKHTILISENGNDNISEIPLQAIFVEKLDIKDTNAPRLLVPVVYYTIDTTKIEYVEFTLKNIGDKTLYIRDIQMSSEQDIYLESMEMEPGFEQKLTIKLKQDQKGSIELGITTNDPIEPYKILRVNCY